MGFVASGPLDDAGFGAGDIATAGRRLVATDSAVTVEIREATISSYNNHTNFAKWQLKVKELLMTYLILLEARSSILFDFMTQRLHL